VTPAGRRRGDGDEARSVGAAGEAVPAASLYIRVLTSLKVRTKEAAEADKLSVNAWAIRCMETCLARNKTMGE
jgi:predicted HicB family RNase H-like nuclease